MKAFEISPEQIGAIVGALVADELSWRFRRHMDFLTLESLSPSTRLKTGGLRLDAAEYEACARRAAGFFDAEAGLLLDGKADTLADWSAALAGAIGRRLARFRFTPAGRDSESESCVHDADAIFAEAAAASNLLHGRRRLISFVAPHGAMGFVLTVLTPNLQQIPTVDARGAPPEELKKLLQFGDVVVATPSLWRFLIGEGLVAPDNSMALYFGEEMPPDLAAEMRQAGFGAQREIYGSTETGLLGWRDFPGEPFLLFDFAARENDRLMRRTPDGGTRAIEAMDALRWDGARTFHLAGRRDGAVQIGGVNVFPARIAAAIEAHDKVRACAIRVGRHEGGFQRLIAHIVLSDGRAPSETIARNIDRYCRAKLHPYERPRVYRFEADLDADILDAEKV